MSDVYNMDYSVIRMDRSSYFKNSFIAFVSFLLAYLLHRNQVCTTMEHI